MSVGTETKPLAKIWADLKEKIRPGAPTFFALKARLPAIGRFDNPIAATDNMTVVLKTYAAGGENALHAHVNEDHVFIVLKGEATFKGPRGETKAVGVYDGVMLPKGAFYSFESSGAEPLVLLRVGCVELESADAFARIDPDGQRMSGMSAANKHVDPVYSDEWFARPR